MALVSALLVNRVAFHLPLKPFRIIRLALGRTKSVSHFRTRRAVLAVLNRVVLVSLATILTFVSVHNWLR
jgi:hypothetical protein